MIGADPAVQPQAHQQHRGDLLRLLPHIRHPRRAALQGDLLLLRRPRRGLAEHNLQAAVFTGMAGSK